METSSQKRRDFVIKLGKILGVASASSFAPQVLAKGRSANIKSVALKSGKNGQQKLVFELDKSARHKIMTLKKPERVVIDFLNTSSKSQPRLGRNISKNALIKKVRHATRNKNDLRVVLDMAQTAKPTTSLRSSGSSYFIEVALSPKRPIKSAQQEIAKTISAATSRVARKPLIIAIDAGHGGKDPGAIGKNGTKEKHVALQIAKKLKKYIDRQPGMKGVLIRDGDYYISLRKRIIKARKNKADMFISIHADANPNPRLTGSSVYILSDKGASSEAARWLAKSENSYETKLAGAKLYSKSKVVNTMLLELSLEDTIDRSLDIAHGVLKELGGVNNLLRRQVESAGFVVLKSPDIPSVLVETAFISNTIEEKRLKTSRHQDKLAKAIFKGIKRYQVAQTNTGTQYS